MDLQFFKWWIVNIISLIAYEAKNHANNSPKKKIMEIVMQRFIVIGRGILFLPHVSIYGLNDLDSS